MRVPKGLTIGVNEVQWRADASICTKIAGGSEVGGFIHHSCQVLPSLC